MANRELVKNYKAEAAIEACRIVKFGAADYVVTQGDAATDKLIGVTLPNLSIASGESCDVIHSGIVDVQLGGTVVRGDPITSDASGQGVHAAPAAGANNSVLGIALVSGISGDIIPVLITLSSVQG